MQQLLNTLYVTEQDTSLRLEGAALSAVHADGRKDHVPLHLLESIVSFSFIGPSPQLLTACAERGIGVFVMTQTGRLRYRVCGETRGNVVLRTRQYSMTDQEKKMLSRASLDGKLRGEQAVIKRFMRNHPERAVDRLLQTIHALERARRALRDAESADALRGIEGAAAAAWFDTFGLLVLADDPMLAFTKRSRRPPRDPCNALLSFAYTLLSGECTQALECAGLDPSVGILHSKRPGKPSLALDLMEEFRPLLADRVVLRVLNLGIVTEKQFEQSEDGTRMTDAGRQSFLRAWRSSRGETVSVSGLGNKAPAGLLPHLQAQAISRLLRDEAGGYRAVQWR